MSGLLYLFICLHTCAPQVFNVCGGQKRESDSLGLELQQLGVAMWALGVKSGSSLSANNKY